MSKKINLSEINNDNYEEGEKGEKDYDVDEENEIDVSHLENLSADISYYFKKYTKEHAIMLGENINCNNLFSYIEYLLSKQLTSDGNS